MSEEIKKKARENLGLIICALVSSTLVAMPLFCAFSGNKTIKKTNEQIILNWLHKTKRGKDIQGVDSKTIVTTAVGTTIREDQIKSAEKTDGGWIVTTRENRMLLVPKK